MGLISYVLQDRLKEDLGRCIDSNIFDKYQEDPLVTASFDKVQIEVSDVNTMISPHGPLLSSDVAVWRVTRTGRGISSTLTTTTIPTFTILPTRRGSLARRQEMARRRARWWQVYPTLT